MAALHGLLLRQLKRLGITEQGSGPAGPEQWAALLERVSRAYTEADQDRYLNERAQTTASREMHELYERLDTAQRIAELGNWSYDCAQRSRLWSERCFAIFGVDPSHPVPTYRQLSRQVDARDRAAVHAAVRAAWTATKGFELQCRLVTPDGQRRWVLVIARPQRDASGRMTRVDGVAVDITRRKRIELRQEAEHAVTKLLANAEEPAQVMPRIIETLCELLGWASGALWLLDHADGVLHRSACWSSAHPRVELFYRQSPSHAAVAGWNTLVGHTVDSGEPTWMLDVGVERTCARRVAAVDSGLRAGLAFPIEVGGVMLGAVELFSVRAEEADADLLQSLHFVGRQIGQFLHRKRAERALRESEAHFRAVVEQASDAIFVHDVDGRIVGVNQRACDMLRCCREELLRMTCEDLAHESSSDCVRKLLGILSKGRPIAMESRYRRKDGSSFAVEISAGPIEVDGRQHVLALVRDISERQQMEERIRHLAFHDPLTGLANRAMFGECIARAVVQAQRHKKTLAVLFIDLDRFKIINDTLGHEAGDRLLQEMARRMRGCLREGDLVARLGGDEFVVLIEEVADPADVAHVARKILGALTEEFELAGQAVHVTASIGISLCPQDGVDEQSLMRFADIAMYRAKEKGKNGYQFFAAQMSTDSSEFLAPEADLRRADPRRARAAVPAQAQARRRPNQGR